jgi:hypothetical protein
MDSRIWNRRTLATITLAAIAGTASAAGVGFAQGSGTSSGAPTSSGATSGTPTSRAPGGILAAVHDALENLVANGTINQQQADAVQQQANAGSIDPKTLVQGGVVSDAQMRAIGNSLDQVKRSFGN